MSRGEVGDFQLKRVEEITYIIGHMYGLISIRSRDISIYIES